MRHLLLCAAALAAACTGKADTADTASSTCTGLAAGEVVVFATGFERSEGIALSPDGRMFITAGDVVAELFPDGTWTEVAALEGGVGLAWWGDRLMAAGYPDDVGHVVAIDVDTGEVTLRSEPIGSPNFLTVTPWDTLLVADADAAIWEVTADGTTTRWLDVPGPNGTAFTADGETLWVVNTWDSPAPVWQVPIAGGAAGEPVQVHAFDAGTFPDGVALGVSGDLYVSLNIAGEIAAVTPDGAARTVGEGARFTASLAFGEGPFDRCAVYSTSLATDEIYAIGVGEPGLPPLR